MGEPNGSRVIVTAEREETGWQGLGRGECCWGQLERGPDVSCT